MSKITKKTFSCASEFPIRRRLRAFLFNFCVQHDFRGEINCQLLRSLILFLTNRAEYSLILPIAYVSKLGFRLAEQLFSENVTPWL